MKIHDILLNCVQDKVGKILTFQEIRDRVQTHYPDLKLSSILPAEHTSEASRSTCTQCKTHPIFRKVGRGFYEVLRQDKPLSPEKSIHEKLQQVLAAEHGKELNTLEIRERIGLAFPETHLPSVIPSDHIRGGACKTCNTSPLFERTSLRGKYRVLAVNSVPYPQELSQTLIDLLKVYGTEMLYMQPETFIEHLSMSLIGQRRAFNLLSLSLRERIPIDWLELSDIVPVNTLHAKLSERLQFNHGIQPEAASQSVKIWTHALNEYRQTESSFNYPQPVNLSAKLAEDSAHFKTNSAQIESDLQTLKLSDTATGYQALKKGNRNIALLFCQSQDNCLLGIKSEQFSKTLQTILKGFNTPDFRCPEAFITRFSPRQTSDWPHQSYSWFQQVPYSLVLDVFKELDRHF